MKHIGACGTPHFLWLYLVKVGEGTTRPQGEQSLWLCKTWTFRLWEWSEHLLGSDLASLTVLSPRSLHMVFKYSLAYCTEGHLGDKDLLLCRLVLQNLETRTINSLTSQKTLYSNRSPRWEINLMHSTVTIIIQVIVSKKLMRRALVRSTSNITAGLSQDMVDGRDKPSSFLLNHLHIYSFSRWYSVLALMPLNWLSHPSDIPSFGYWCDSALSAQWFVYEAFQNFLIYHVDSPSHVLCSPCRIILIIDDY